MELVSEVRVHGKTHVLLVKDQKCAVELRTGCMIDPRIGLPAGSPFSGIGQTAEVPRGVEQLFPEVRAQGERSVKIGIREEASKQLRKRVRVAGRLGSWLQEKRN